MPRLSKYRPYLLIPCLAIFCSFLVISLTHGGTALTTDSLYYLTAAQLLAEGHGISQPNFDLSSTVEFIPVTMWPPAYPLILSLFISFAHSPEVAASYLNVFGLSITLFVFTAMVKRSVGIGPGVVFGLFLALQSALLTIYSHAWSETLFVPLILLSYWSGLKYVESVTQDRSRAQWFWLILAGLFLGAAGNTRYLGLVFLPGLVTIVWIAGAKTRGHAWKRTISLMGVVLLSLAPAMVRNYIYSGFFSGGDRGAPVTSLLDDMRDLTDLMVLNFFDFNVPVLVILAVTTAAAVLLVVKKVMQTPDQQQSHDWRTEILLPLVWIVSAFFTLIVLHRVQNIDLDTRMISVVVPFILLAVAGTGKWLVTRTGTPLVLVPIVLWMSVQTYHGGNLYQKALASWRTGEMPFYATRNLRYANVAADPNLVLMKYVYGQLHETRGDFLVFNEFRPIQLSYLLHAKVKEVPFPLTADTISKMNSIGGSGAVFWLTGEKSLDDLSRLYGDQLPSLKWVEAAKALGQNVIQMPMPIPAIIK